MKNEIIQSLQELDKFKELAEQINCKKTPINISGLVFVGKSHIISSLKEEIKRPICVITYNELQAKNMVKDLRYFTDKVEYFGKREIASYDYVSESKDLPFARIDVLNKLKNKDVNIVVTTIEAIMQSMIPEKVLYKNILTFTVGNMFESTGFSGKKNLNNLKKLLLLMGYERNDLVEARGQFSIRGGIVDIGLTEKTGIRIEFWGDEVDSIRYFGLASQRTTEMTDKITIYPAHEYILNYERDKSKEVEILPEYSEIVSNICKNIEEKYILEKNKKMSSSIENATAISDAKDTNIYINEKSKEKVEVDIEAITNGEYISKIDKYFNEFYENVGTFLEYLPKNILLCIDENTKITQRAENILIENNNLIKSLVEKERFIPEGILNVSNFNINSWNDIHSEKKTIYLEENNRKTENKFEFNYRQINVYKSELEILKNDIEKWQKENKNIVVLAGGKEAAEKAKELIGLGNMASNATTDFTPVPKGDKNVTSVTGTKVTTGGLSSGFECYDANLVVISLSDALEGEVKKKKSSPTFRQGEKIVFADLKPGDFVVHKTHGIGEFVGVNTIEADGVTKDYIKIRYKNNDMLYVPTNNLDNVRKYIGGGDSAPTLNKLGGKEWSNTKARVKKNLREVAKDLIELYAKRQQAKGYAFSGDTDWQKQFEEEFPYQETDDQLRCIDEVKKDMEQQRPMDRLLCGDVGYGKTEVAIRAAFKAVMDHKQVAYLVPTTILANQQYEGFKSRMENFGVNVELLNRFRTKKEQNEVVKKLKLGEIDVVVGTHRLLSEDVTFKDLGLLIIDEEHRFGVKDKEKIKKLKTSVDVLTMTATPIPRTLHMSILGVRDMSVIYEPPQNRRPVQTYVLEYDTEVIKEAITKELEREGQVFYLYNNVENISKKAMDIQELVPEAKVEFAHGKMTGRELENIMERFINKEINVLVCTTILESGIDIPNANTIIVENADRLGLAQLYQIRGRVGRSDKQGYAYVTYRRDKLLSEVADKRLKAIREFTEFGSGFKIAMRDLEIRGAGSLLGEIQHGHMEQVGYDTYCNLLDQVVKEMQGMEVTESDEEPEIQIDINVSSYIPDSYIENGSQKIEVYQNIALCRTEEDIQNVIDELIDRYGVMPKELENLIEVARIKEMCRNAGIVKISEKRSMQDFQNTRQSIVFYFDKNKYKPEMVDNLIKKYGYNIKFSTGIEPYVTLKIGNVTEEELIERIKEFLHEI
jgi:transcription-repair coupling factor (superfamily II helicase)